MLFSESYAGSASAELEDEELKKELHRTIQKVTQRIEVMRFNTMVSALMEFVNFLSDRYHSERWRTNTYHESLEILMIMLAPAAPFLAEELWHRTGHEFSVHNQAWPVWDADLAKEELKQIPVQINGKLRGLVEVPISADQNEVESAAFDLPEIRERTGDDQIYKVIHVPGKIMNILTRN